MVGARKLAMCTSESRTNELMEGRLPTSDGLLRRLRHLAAHCSFVSPRTGRADIPSFSDRSV